jgi:hypothetical protein
MPGKRVRFDNETWAAVALLARDSMRDLQELADEAFRDLLAKHHRPVTLKEQLRKSVADDEALSKPTSPASSPQPQPKRRRPRRPS